MTAKVRSLRTSRRLPLTVAAQNTDAALQPLVDLWFRLRQSAGELPDYRRFDPTSLPPRVWPYLFVVKLEGARRRFFYELIGGEIERHNGFPGQKRFLTDLPLKNRHVMAREFALTLRYRLPTLSEGPYLGVADYIETVHRVIAPFALGDREFAFVAMARFTAFAGMEHLAARANDKGR